MSESLEFVLQRAQGTRAAQAAILLAWVWEEKTLVQWDSSIAAFVLQMEAVEDADADVLGKRGELDAAIEALRSLTRRCLNIAKNKYRNTPAKLEVLAHLKVEAGSRSGKLQEALEWESAWEEVDAAWVPLTGVTLASFKTQRLATQTLLESFTNVQASAKGEATKLAQLKDQLSADCHAWYEAATNVFLEGTPEGDLIRSTVPTTYTAPSNPPTALEINTATPQVGGNIATTYVPGGGAGATSTRLEWKVVGVDADFDHSVAVNLAGQTVSGFTAGQTVNLRVKTANAAGNTYSAVKTTTLP
jgi:hypothetical protein